MRVLITGISAGLGAALAKHALGQGHTVWGCSRRAPGEELTRFGERFHYRALDLSESARGPAELRDWLGPEATLDRVILNAGILPPISDLRSAELETMRRTMEINLWANQWLLATLLEGSRRVGEVIAISSGAAVSGQRGWNAYALSKAALNMLIRLYAAECPETRFIAFAPGLIDTDMQAYIAGLEGAAGQLEVIARLKSARGTERMPSPAVAAERCWKAFEALPSFESGCFVDLRELSGAER